MALADAFGGAPLDAGDVADNLARQTFPDDVQAGPQPIDSGPLADATLRRLDRKTRHIDDQAPETVAAKPPSSYGEPVVTGPKPSSFGEPVKAPEEPLGATGNTKALLKGIPAGAI